MKFNADLRKTVMAAVLDPMLSPKEQRKIIMKSFNEHPDCSLAVNSEHQLQVRRSKVLQQLIKQGFLKQTREFCTFSFNSGGYHSESYLVKA